VSVLETGQDVISEYVDSTRQNVQEGFRNRHGGQGIDDILQDLYTPMRQPIK